MNFIFALLISGVILIAMPLLSHMHYVSEFTKIASVVVNSQGYVNSFPEEPIVWYAVSAGSGGVLIVAALGLGLFKELSKSRNSD